MDYLIIATTIIAFGLYLYVVVNSKFDSSCTQDCSQGRNCTCVKNETQCCKVKS